MIIFPNTSRVFKHQLCIQDVRVGKEGYVYHEIFHTRDSRLKGRKIFDWANNTDLLKPFVSIYLAKQNSLDLPKYS